MKYNSGLRVYGLYIQRPLWVLNRGAWLEASDSVLVKHGLDPLSSELVGKRSPSKYRTRTFCGTMDRYKIVEMVRKPEAQMLRNLVRTV